MQQKGGGRDTPQYSTGPILRDWAHSARSLAGRTGITRSTATAASPPLYHRLADAGARWVAAVIACNFHYRLRESRRGFFFPRAQKLNAAFTRNAGKA